ncbi:MAG TPA: helix-turn-helix domain-containing protein [Puia sp.]|nr:helix-turn-helix domain-containing protein [Puia sp.]
MSRHCVLLVASGRTECSILATGLKDVADVLSIKNTADALHVLETRIIHLIIVEASGNNHDLCGRIKGVFQYAHIPVLVLIHRDALSTRLQWLRVGADACLDTPVFPPHLLAQVENLLANRARLKDHFETFGLLQRKNDPAVPGPDTVLWERLNRLIMLQLSNATLDVSLLARELHMSRPTLYRKITEISNMTPAALITQTRLDKAALLLATTGHPVTEVSRMVGFCTRNGFGKAFSRRFGVTPSEYRRKTIAARETRI